MDKIAALKYVGCIKSPGVPTIQVILKIFCITANYDCGHSAGATARFLATVAVCHRVGNAA